MGVEDRFAGNCKNFMEYDEFEVRNDPNFFPGDGECEKGVVRYVINGEYLCSSKYVFFEEYEK